MGEREKREGRLFEKRLGEKLSAASRKAGGSANNGGHKIKLVIFSFCNLHHNITAIYAQM